MTLLIPSLSWSMLSERIQSSTHHVLTSGSIRCLPPSAMRKRATVILARARIKRRKKRYLPHGKKASKHATGLGPKALHTGLGAATSNQPQLSVPQGLTIVLTAIMPQQLVRGSSGLCLRLQWVHKLPLMGIGGEGLSRIHSTSRQDGQLQRLTTFIWLILLLFSTFY
ncbi:Hypothetical predicted protein [Pelobates cultripes]|uniref:Uncharacterized protein n=1 Tax=Pelobates cultripes TaxID=61616 RepID=A0AAD1W6S4_PELCU|nr:Hypothetical predicted protein [Pelobates cultripes]